jgi:hypothetical protein
MHDRACAGEKASLYVFDLRKRHASKGGDDDRNHHQHEPSDFAT